MPGTKSDGSIRIDTSLDTTGFHRGSKEMMQATQSLVNRVNAVGGSIKDAFRFDFGTLKRDTNSFTQALRDTRKEVSQIGQDGLKTFAEDAEGMARLEQRTQQTGAKLGEMRTELEKMGSTNFESEAFQNLGKEMDETQKKISAIEQKQAEFREALMSDPTYRSTYTQWVELTKEAKMYKAAAEAAQEAGDPSKAKIFAGKAHNAETWASSKRNVLDTMESGQRKGLASSGDYREALGAYQNAQKEVDKINAVIEKALEQGDQKMAQYWQRRIKLYEVTAQTYKRKLDTLVEKSKGDGQKGNLDEQLNGLRQRYAELEAQRQQMLNDGTATYLGSETAQYKVLKDQLQSVADSYQELVQARSVQAAHDAGGGASGSGFNFGSIVEWNAVQEQWRGMNTLSGMVQAAFGRVRDAAQNMAAGVSMAGSAVYTAVHDPLGAVDRALGAVVSGAGKALMALRGLAAGAIGTGLRSIASYARQAALRLAEMAANAAHAARGAIVNGLKSLASSITGIGKQSRGANVSLSGGLKTVLKYGLGIRSLYVLFNKLRSAITSGFAEIAKADPEFNGVLSRFKASLSGLKMSFASAFAPLAQYVMPLLTRFINQISAVISRLGMLFASLTGKKTFMQAQTAQEDYGAAVDGTTDSMKQQTKAAKKDERQLAGFDDVEILKSNDDDQPSSSGGGSSPFSAVPIDKSVGNLADMLKDMWKNADFTELGRMLGQKLKAALESIPWGQIKAVLRKIAQSIATFLNGFLEVPGLFYVIGKTIAEAINSAFEFVESFVRSFHWDSLGKAVHDMILGVFNNIDWSLIYLTMTELGNGIGTALENALNNPEVWNAVFTALANGLNSVVYFLDSFVTSVNWGDLATNIATGLNTGIEGIDWGTLGQTLVDILNGAFEFWYNFVTTFDFTKFGTHIGETLSKVLKEVNWTEGGASVAETINGLFDALNGFIGSTDWAALGAAVIDVVAGFFGNLDWANFSEFITKCVTGLFDFLKGAFDEVKWDELPGKIASAISDFLSGFDWQKMATSVGGLIGAAFKAIITVGSTLWEDMKSVGKDIMEGGLTGIKDKLSGISKWITENVVDPFVDAFKTAFGIASPSKVMEPYGENVSEGILGGADKGFSNIRSWLQDHISNPFINGVKNLFGIGGGSDSALTDDGESLIEGMKTGVSNGMSDIDGWTEQNVTGPVSDAFAGGLGLGGGNSTVFNGFGSDIVSGLQSGMADNASTATGEAETLAGDVYGKFGLSWSDIGSDIIDGIYAGISSGWNWLTTEAWNLAVDIYNSACDALGIASPSKKFAWVAEMICAGMSEGLTDNAETAVSAVSDVADAATAEAEKASPIIPINTAVADFTDGLDGMLDSFADKVANGFDRLIERLESLAAGSFVVPSVANGSVIPYASRRTTAEGQGDVLSDLLATMAAKSGEGVSQDALEEILTRVIRDNMRIEFYIGDEQIARHAMAGSARIDRRYNPVTA